MHCARYLRVGRPYVTVGSANRDWTYWALATTVWQTLRNAHWPLSPWLGGTGRAWKTVLVMEPPVDDMEHLAAAMAGEAAPRRVREGGGHLAGGAESTAADADRDGTGEARPLRVIVDSEWGFAETVAAYERLERGHLSGKIIVRVAKDI